MMRFDDPAPDRDLGDVLHRFDPKPALSELKLGVLTRRIVSRSGPFLRQRRQGGAASWWQYAGAWARTLIPLGITTTLVAVGFILWATLAPLPLPSERVAMSDAMAEATVNDAISQRLLDALVLPVERAAKPTRDQR
jgi:hypothetical protein